MSVFYIHARKERVGLKMFERIIKDIEIPFTRCEKMAFLLAIFISVIYYFL